MTYSKASRCQAHSLTSVCQAVHTGRSYSSCHLARAQVSVAPLTKLTASSSET